MRHEDPRWTVDRRDFLRLGGVTGAVLLATGGRVLARTGSSLRREFEAAAGEFGVPADLLVAMSYVNTLWEMPPPWTTDYERGDTHGRGAYGIMQLVRNPSEDTLGRAAALTGLPEESLESEREANIRGGAALLADIMQSQQQNRPSDLDGWYEAVALYGEIDLYAREVYETLRSGAAATISSGERVELAPRDVHVPQTFTAQRTRDYPRARWRPAHASNYTNANRERSHPIDIIVIHVAQGSYSGTVRWFGNPAADASAHYVVSRRGRVAQCVRDEDIAWHAGYWRTNTRSIGIEHEGYIGNPRWFTHRMYRSSARLSAWLCKRHRIPIDRRHIIGHNQVPGCPGPGGGVDCHRDPGRFWNWEKYLRLVRHYRRRLR